MNKNTTTAREAFAGFMKDVNAVRLTTFARHYCDTRKITRDVIDRATAITTAAGRQFVTTDDIKAAANSCAS